MIGVNPCLHSGAKRSLWIGKEPIPLTRYPLPWVSAYPQPLWLWIRGYPRYLGGIEGFVARINLMPSSRGPVRPVRLDNRPRPRTSARPGSLRGGLLRLLWARASGPWRPFWPCGLCGLRREFAFELPRIVQLPTAPH